MSRRLEAVLHAGNFQVFEHRDTGISPIVILEDASKVTPYSTWLNPSMSVKDTLAAYGLSDSQVALVMNALAHGRDARLQFDFSR